MKRSKYCPRIAAKLCVEKHAEHGLSRHADPDRARTRITSVMSEKAHKSALTVYSVWLWEIKQVMLHKSTVPLALEFLDMRASIVRQSTVSLGRQAINMCLHAETPIQFVRSSVPTTLRNRAYTEAEIRILVHKAPSDLALSINVCADGGLRAMELLTIADVDDLPPSPRNWLSTRFSGRIGDIAFAVRGKGGLVREIRMNPDLADRLDSLKRASPARVSNRGAHLTAFYTLIGGHQFSLQFGRLSDRVLGFSLGAHGLRHSFSQRRLTELLCLGFEHESAVEILSQELGHFSTSNTWSYLRNQLDLPRRQE